MAVKKSKINKSSPNKTGRPALFSKPEEMQSQIDAYFQTRQPEIIKNDDGTIARIKLNPPTVSGLALFLGFTDRTSLYEYKGYGKKFSDTVKRAITRIADYAEERAISGEGWGGAAFWLKNHGWTAEEKREIIITPPIKADISKLKKLREGLK